MPSPTEPEAEEPCYMRRRVVDGYLICGCDRVVLSFEPGRAIPAGTHLVDLQGPYDPRD